MSAIRLQNLVKIFPGGVRAADDVSFDVANGERVVLVGPSGCGKTTLLRLIAGLETPTTGFIVFDGRMARDLPPQKRGVAMLFQQPALYPHLNVRRNLAFTLKFQKLDKAEIASRVAETAAMLGIDELLERKPWELSGGQQQRVALGRTIIRRPKILLLDEPLSHLDAALRDQMRREIIGQQERLGAAMIYVTHDRAEANAVGHRIIEMDNGRVRQIQNCR
jgi:ABC-type sugar transport system ATPase subunit